MSRRGFLVIVALVVMLGLGLWVRQWLAPANVVRRALLGAIASFEQEQILGAMKVISRSYHDRWGMSYETLAGHMKEAMDTYDNLQVDVEPPVVEVQDAQASVRFRFVLWGTYEGTRGYVIGSLTDPCTVTLLWRKEPQGWRIVATDELDIPELRDELREMSDE
jgi:hypothetical protein